MLWRCDCCALCSVLLGIILPEIREQQKEKAIKGLNEHTPLNSQLTHKMRRSIRTAVLVISMLTNHGATKSFGSCFVGFRFSFFFVWVACGVYNCKIAKMACSPEPSRGVYGIWCTLVLAEPKQVKNKTWQQGAV